LTSQGLLVRHQGKGTFRTDGHQRRPNNQRSLLVGVWFDWPTGPLFGPIAEGIREELGRHGYHAVFEKGGVGRGAERRGITSLVAKGLDGFIVAPSSNTEEAEHRPLAELIDRRLHIVLIDRLLPGHETDLVTTDGELGAEEMVEHLITLGHQRIGFIGIEGLSTIEERCRGYRFTMRRHGLALEEDWVQMDAKVAEDSGREAAARLFSLPAAVRPTAVFGANDMIAGMAAMVAGEHGLRVPEDLSIAGFDDVVIEPERHSWLTTYAQPKQRIGRQAARLLMKRIENPSTRAVTICLPGKLVVRQSTSAPPAES
jgi:DNA-binding LacI/PurR family transcriptional regulator